MLMYRIREILNQKGMTSKELAEKMDVTPQYISGIVRGTGSASVEVLSNIAKALNVPLASLFSDYVPDENVIVCPSCGARFGLKKED